MPFAYKVLAKDGTWVYTNIDQPGAIAADVSNYSGFQPTPAQAQAGVGVDATLFDTRTGAQSMGYFSGAQIVTNTPEAIANVQATSSLDPNANTFMGMNVPDSNPTPPDPISAIHTPQKLLDTLTSLGLKLTQKQKDLALAAGGAALGVAGTIAASSILNKKKHGTHLRHPHRHLMRHHKRRSSG